LKNAQGPDAADQAVREYDGAISTPGYTITNNERKAISDALPRLKGPLNDLGIDGSTRFHFSNIYAGNPQKQPVSDRYHSVDKKTTVASDLSNLNYGPKFTGTKAKQSQMLFGHWKVEAGESNVGKLQYVVRSNIENDDTRDIITDIFGGIKPGSKEEFPAYAKANTREKAAFDALSGSDNGRMVFLMLADNFEAFGGKTVKSAHAYIEDDSYTMNMTWELTV